MLQKFSFLALCALYICLSAAIYVPSPYAGYNDSLGIAVVSDLLAGSFGTSRSLDFTLISWNTRTRKVIWNSTEYPFRFPIGFRRGDVLVTATPNASLVYSSATRVLSLDPNSGSLKRSEVFGPNGTRLAGRPLILTSGTLFAFAYKLDPLTRNITGVISLPSGKDVPGKYFEDVSSRALTTSSATAAFNDTVYFLYKEKNKNGNISLVQYNGSGLNDPVIELTGPPIQMPALVSDTNADDSIYVYGYRRGLNSSKKDDLFVTFTKVDRKLKEIVWEFAGRLTSKDFSPYPRLLKPVFAAGYVVFPLLTALPANVMTLTISTNNNGTVSIGNLTQTSFILLYLDPQNGNLVRGVSRIPPSLNKSAVYTPISDSVFFSHETSSLVLVGSSSLQPRQYIFNVDIYDDLDALGVPTCAA